MLENSELQELPQRPKAQLQFLQTLAYISMPVDNWSQHFIKTIRNLEKQQ